MSGKKCTKEVVVFSYVRRSEPFVYTSVYMFSFVYTSVAIKCYLNLVTVLLENIHLNFVSLVQMYVPVNFEIFFFCHAPHISDYILSF